MFKVHLSCKSKRRYMVSKESYKTKEDADNFICDHIENQMKTCWQTWGMCDYEVKELRNGYAYKVTYKPCLKLFKNLIIEYEIVEI